MIIGILTYKLDNHLEKALRDISTISPRQDIFVIDSGRTPETTEPICQRYGAKYLSFGKKLSAAEAVNRAFKYAFDKSDYLLKMDNDVYGLTDVDLAFVQSRLDNTDYDIYFLLTNGANPLDTPNWFAAYVIRKRIWQRIGGFDETFRMMYNEDLDYTIRLIRDKTKTAVIAGLNLKHDDSSTIKESSVEDKSLIADAKRYNWWYLTHKWGEKAQSALQYFQAIHTFDNRTNTLIRVNHDS